MSYPRLRFVAAALTVVIGVPACTELITNPNCADDGDEYQGYSAVVTITDALGRPAVLGTTVRLIGSGIDEAIMGRYPDEEVVAIGGDAGRFTLVITRPWWVSQSIEGLTVARPKNACVGVTPSRHSVVLELAPDAPPIRQVVPDREHMEVSSDPPFTGSNSGGGRQLTAFVEADPGESMDVLWTAVDPEILTVTPDGRLAAKCRTEPIETLVVARSGADPTVTASMRVTVNPTTLWECPRSAP